jgi:hypothetical protein
MARPGGIVNLADPERLLPAPLGLSGQHNRRAKEFPHPSCRATDTTSIPWADELTMPFRRRRDKHCVRKKSGLPYALRVRENTAEDAN